MDVFSPITKRNNVSLIEKIQCDELIQAWKENLLIDISECISTTYSEIYLYKCNDTNLLFYYPLNISATEEIYSQLQKFDWYYMSWKWEYSVASQDLLECKKVLEIGSGKGVFVDYLRHERSIEAVGLELNSKAVEECLEKGIPVLRLSLSELINQNFSALPA
jgi:hypothetical protein